MSDDRKSLRASLAYEPVELKFGTSGRRGEVRHLTQLEIYINVVGELEYLLTVDREHGGIRRGDEFYLASDLRPSSTRLVPEEGNRGEICQTVALAAERCGLHPVYLGHIPTPALMSHAVMLKRGSIMVTGSHIPFRLNGYKLNTSRGELLKKDEALVNESVARVRERIYNGRFDMSLFDENGMLGAGHRRLPDAIEAGERAYVHRFTEFFPPDALKGLKLLAYQHSAVGRDLLVEILTALGAEVVPAGRSETFVPIDTENIGAEQLATVQALADRVPGIDAVVSTDGDSDRPLLLGAEPESGQVRFFSGDLLGMVAAEYLGADGVAVPITCNDAIDRGPLAARLEPKTRVGSPYVIAAMEEAKARGRHVVCGWEANGGFLTGSEIVTDGRTLPALPTRDAVLPILCALSAARQHGVSLIELFGKLPKRFSRAGLLKDFPRSAGRTLIARYSNPEAASELARFFPAAEGFGTISRVDFTDGIRIYFENEDVVHLRPSGNADEFRIYSVANTEERANSIVSLGLAEPDGILRRLERSMS